LVIFIHCLVNAADAADVNYEKNMTVKQKEDGIIKSLVQIGIPMFFYISGIASTFFDTEKYHYGIFVGGKVLRILVPFVIGIFVFLIPRLYFGQTYEDYTRVDGQEITTDYWEFTRGTLPTIYLKLSWLWYLPALFIDLIICYPLLRWSIRRSRGIPFDPLVDLGIITLQILTLFLWAVPNYYLITTDDYNMKYSIPAVITLCWIFFAFYVLQLLAARPNGHVFAVWLKLIGPIGSVCLNLWKTQTRNMNLYHIFLMINYDAVFFSQGCVDQCYWRKMVKGRKDLADTALAPLAVVFFLFMYSLTSPMNFSKMGHLFFYPLYETYWLQCLYTSGTWLWVYAIIWTMAATANEKFNETVFNYVTGASMYAYLSHYFFIILFGVFVIRPYHIDFVPGVALMFFGTQALIMLTYIPLNYLYELVFPPKPTKKMELDEKTPEQIEEEKEREAAAAKARAIENGEAAVDLENDHPDDESKLSKSVVDKRSNK